LLALPQAKATTFAMAQRAQGSTGQVLQEMNILIREKRVSPVAAFCVGITLMVVCLVWMIVALVHSKKQATGGNTVGSSRLNQSSFRSEHQSKLDDLA